MVTPIRVQSVQRDICRECGSRLLMYSVFDLGHQRNGVSKTSSYYDQKWIYIVSMRVGEVRSVSADRSTAHPHLPTWYFLVFGLNTISASEA